MEKNLSSRFLKFKKENIVAMELAYLREKYTLTIFLTHSHTQIITGEQAFTIYQEYLKDDETAFTYEV